jgi:hypothetical protein
LTEPRGIVSAELASAAIALALPTLRALLDTPGVSGERVLHIVVIDPACDPHRSPADDAVLHEHTLGDPAHWGADYRSFARAKARLAWKLGRDTQQVQDEFPHLLARGDTLLGGGIVRKGLVVGVSGAHPWYDAACAGIVAEVILALAQQRARDLRAAGALALDA